MRLSVTTSMHDHRISRLLLPIASFAMTFDHLLPIWCMTFDHLLPIWCLQLETKF
jgi:hypothetical protein